MDADIKRLQSDASEAVTLGADSGRVKRKFRGIRYLLKLMWRFRCSWWFIARDQGTGSPVCPTCR